MTFLECERERDRKYFEIEKERIRQRDLELQLQRQWLDLVSELLKYAKDYFNKDKSQ